MNPNAIAFNGTIISDEPINVGDGYYVINILAGDKEDFPMLLLKTTLEELNEAFRKNDKVAGVGILKKIQNEWCVEVKEINRMLSDEEIKELK